MMNKTALIFTGKYKTKTSACENKANSSRLAFSLIEVILYTAIVSIALGTMMSLADSLLNNQQKSGAVTEVQENAQFSLYRIQQTIKGAAAVSIPTAGATSSTLLLEMVDPAQDPAQVVLDDDVIRLTLGTSGPQRLTSDRVKIKDLIFEHIADQGGPPNIVKISYIVEHINLGKGSQFNYTLPVQSSVTIPR